MTPEEKSWTETLALAIQWFQEDPNGTMECGVTFRQNVLNVMSVLETKIQK